MTTTRLITLLSGVVGVALTQLYPVLPEGKVKAWTGVLAGFLVGLPVTVFGKKASDGK